MDKIDYLEAERVKLWERISQIGNRLEALTIESEQEANSASKKTSEYRNRAKATHEELSRIHSDIVSQADSISRTSKKSLEEADGISKLLIAANQEHAAVCTIHTQIQEVYNELLQLSESADESRVNLENRTRELEEAAKLLAKIQDSFRRSELLFKNSSEIAEKIDDINTDIFGYEDESEDGTIKKVDGLKDKLEKSFIELNRKADSLTNRISESIAQTDEKLKSLHTEWTEKHQTLGTKIESLLPNALTAGLSHAYSTKKEQEILEGSRIAKAFYISIAGLVAISFIPFGISMHAVFSNNSIEESLSRVPRLVLAILPLYVPVLWVAYSANRRSNLSKRLVEEYSHKEVLAKTYEGLSKQVSELPGDISTELRTKLLYNILEISAENPGKLISDYNKTDHPLMDALDKSIKLTNAVEKLARIPGFSKVATQMKERADRVLREEGKKASDGLRAVDSEK